MASSRPMGPMPSPVFACRPTRSTSMPRMSASRWRMTLAMGQELGTLGEDDAVDVDDLPAQRGHGVERGGEHFGRIAAAVVGIGVGKHLADVAQGGGAEQGVDHGVQQGVAVAVADRLPIVGNIDAAQPQRPARLQPMQVVSDSYPHRVRGWGSLSRRRNAV